MTNIANLLIEHMAIWTSAETEKKSGRGRASGIKGTVYGVQKLRELILELAVRGKLVPQEPTDEPASELLKRIQAEKAKLIAEGKLKKQKPFAPIKEDEKLFELPKGWEWTRLGNIQTFTNGYAFKSPEFQNAGIGVIRIGDVGNDGAVTTNSMLFFPYERKAEIPKKFIVEPGDLVISMTGNVKLAFNNSHDIFFINQRVGKIEPHLISKFYLYRYLSTVAQEKIDNASGGVIPNVSTEEINETLIPLPPLAEQYRIVDKVDELMALCDQLEHQHSTTQEAHETLVNQLLATLTQSHNAAEFNTNWQRIYADFDVLFTTDASIDALKQTLLQLAVMGKLVPQDLNDEPSSELLKRIQAEKAKLIAEGKLKKEKLLAPISENEKPFKLPKGWEWIRFNELINPLYPISYGVLVPGLDEAEGIPFVRIADLDINNPPIKPEKSISRKIEAQYARTRLEGGEVLMGVVGSIGKLGVAPESWKGANIARAICRIKLSNSINKEYVLWLLQSAFMQNNFIGDTKTLAQPTLNIALIRLALTPLPPLEEQHRIVAKVDALMTLCDQLKTLIKQVNQQQQTIADALVAQALKPATAEVIDLAAYRAAVTCNIIKRMQHNQAFGRTFAMKLLYLSQQHIGFETHLEFEREAAGPFDQWIYDFEREGIAAGWFGRVEKQLANGHTKIEYQVKSAIDEPVAFMSRVGSTEQRKELDRLFALFADKKTEDAEIVATLFAAWNDFLLSGVSPTDEQIIQEVREQWHPAKAKFTPEQLKHWLDWMRDNSIVPTGEGSKTIYQQNLLQ